MSLGGATGYMRPEDYLVSNGGPSALYLPYAQFGPYRDIMSRMGNQGYVSSNQIAPTSLSSGAMGGYDPNMYQRAAAPAASVAAPTATRVSNTQRGFTPGPVDLTDPYSASIVAANPAAYADFNPKRGSGVDLTDPYSASIVAANPDAYVDYNPKRGSAVDLTDPYSASQYYASGPTWNNVGGSGKGGSPDPTGSGPNSWSSFTDAQKAKWFSENQDSPITSFQKLVEGVWPYTSIGMLQNAFDPNIMAKQALITQGVDPGAALQGTNVGTISQPNPITGYSIGPEGQTGTTYEGKRGFVAGSTGGGGGYAAGSYSGAPAAGSDVGRSPPGSAHAGLAKGGQVSMQHLQGPNPAGPDEGYGALKSGEFVINDKAVSKYGIEIMNAINSGKISKGKLRGLLEM